MVSYSTTSHTFHASSSPTRICRRLNSWQHRHPVTPRHVPPVLSFFPQRFIGEHKRDGFLKQLEVLQIYVLLEVGCCSSELLVGEQAADADAGFTYTSKHHQHTRFNEFVRELDLPSAGSLQKPILISGDDVAGASQQWEVVVKKKTETVASKDPHPAVPAEPVFARPL